MSNETREQENFKQRAVGGDGGRRAARVGASDDPGAAVQIFTTCWNGGWIPVRIVEAFEGRAFDTVPTDTEERVVFALKYADETMASPRSSTRATRSTR